MPNRMADIKATDGCRTKLSSRINQLIDEYTGKRQQSTCCSQCPKKRLVICEPNYPVPNSASPTTQNSKCFCRTRPCSSSCASRKSLHYIDLYSRTTPACAKNKSSSHQIPYCSNTCSKCGRVESNCLCRLFSCNKCGKLNTFCVCVDIPCTRPRNNVDEVEYCCLPRVTSSVESYKTDNKRKDCLCQTSPYSGACFCTGKTHCCSCKYWPRDDRTKSSSSPPHKIACYEPSRRVVYLEKHKKERCNCCKCQVEKSNVPCVAGTLSLCKVSSNAANLCSPRGSHCPYSLKNKCEAILRKYESKPMTDYCSVCSRTHSSRASITYETPVCPEIMQVPSSTIKSYINCDPRPLLSPNKSRPSYLSRSPKSSCQPCPSKPHFLPCSLSPPQSPCSPKPSQSTKKLTWCVNLPKNKQELPYSNTTLPIPKCDCCPSRMSRNQPCHWQNVQVVKEEDGVCPCSKEKPVKVDCCPLLSKPPCSISVCSDASGSTRSLADVTASENYNTRRADLWSIKPPGWKWNDVHVRPDILLRAMSHIDRPPPPTWSRKFINYRPSMPEWMTFSPTIRCWHTALCC